MHTTLPLAKNSLSRKTGTCLAALLLTTQLCTAPAEARSYYLPQQDITYKTPDRTIGSRDLINTSARSYVAAYRLLNGLDDISLTLQHADTIAAYEATRPSFKPKTLPARTAG